MKIKDFVLQLIYRACTVCVGISVLFFIFAQIMTAAAGGWEELGISFSQYGLFILFSFLLTGAGYLFRLPLPKIINILIHFAVCGVSFFVIFIAASKITLQTTSTVFILIVVFTLLYAAAFGAYSLLKYLFGPKKEKHDKEKAAAQSYEKRF